MPLPHPPEFASLNVFTAQPDPYLWLFEVLDPDGGPIVGLDDELAVLRVTPNPVPVQFGADDQGEPLTWDPYPVAFGALERDQSGSVAQIDLTASNANGLLMTMLEKNDYFRGYRVRMRLVHSNYLDDPSKSVLIDATVVDVAADWTRVTFSLSSYALADFSVPKTILQRSNCRWTYRQKGCDFIGDPGNAELGDCAKTLDACKLRGDWEADNGLEVRHPKVNGSFPSMPSGSFPLPL